LAGKVESVGKNVKFFKKEDEVYGFLIFGGTCAEYVSIPENKLAWCDPMRLQCYV